MSSVVLDAVAVTAVLRREPGHEAVVPHLRGALISCVNLAEVLCISRTRGSLPEFDDLAISRMQLRPVPFDEDQARFVASIYSKTLGGTVGLADRACMALGLSRNLPVLTGVREWLNFDVGVDVRLFRNG